RAESDPFLWQSGTGLGKMAPSYGQTSKTLKSVKNSECALATSPAMDIQSIKQLVADDMQQVDRLIQQSLHTDVALIDQLSHYIVNSGGKRLRPALMLLIARHFKYTCDQHINLAAIIEFIHTA